MLTNCYGSVLILWVFKVIQWDESEDHEGIANSNNTETISLALLPYINWEIFLKIGNKNSIANIDAIWYFY